MKKLLVPSALLILLIAVGFGFYWYGARRAASSIETKTAPQAKIIRYHCVMHPLYISDHPGNCPFCGMKLVPMEKGPASDSDGQEKGNSKAVRIDPTTVQNMGVRTELVEARDLRVGIRTSGKVLIDETRLTAVNARVMGYVEKLHADFTGRKIVKDQPLLELYSPDLVSAQEEFLQAVHYAGSADGAAGTRELVESSRRRLINWGISENEIRTLEKRGEARHTMAILSPVNGIVLEKTVVQGQNVTEGMELFKIADLSKVWVTASVYQSDLDVAKIGADADIELSYLPGKVFKGTVSFVSPLLDEQTKTVSVRIEVANTPALDLKPGMFATVEIRAAAIRNAIAIPEQSVIRSGKRNIAIIALGGGYFEPREVRLGRTADGYVEVLDGIEKGETLVISAQFLIDSESNLKTAIRQMDASREGGGPDMPAMNSAPEKK